MVPTTSPSMDIQVASNFERILFEADGRDDKSVRAMMGSLAQSRRFALPGDTLSALRGLFAANRADEAETAAAIRTLLRETGHFIDPHTAVGVAVAEKETPRPVGADGRALDRACGEIPRCGRGRLRPSARRCRTGSATSMTVPNASRRCPSIRRRSNATSCPPAAPHAKEPPHERRSHAPAVRA